MLKVLGVSELKNVCDLVFVTQPFGYLQRDGVTRILFQPNNIKRKHPWAMNFSHKANMSFIGTPPSKEFVPFRLVTIIYSNNRRTKAFCGLQTINMKQGGGIHL